MVRQAATNAMMGRPGGKGRRGGGGMFEGKDGRSRSPMNRTGSGSLGKNSKKDKKKQEDPMAVIETKLLGLTNPKDDLLMTKRLPAAREIMSSAVILIRNVAPNGGSVASPNGATATTSASSSSSTAPQQAQSKSVANDVGGEDSGRSEPLGPRPVEQYLLPARIAQMVAMKNGGLAVPSANGIEDGGASPTGSTRGLGVLAVGAATPGVTTTAVAGGLEVDGSPDSATKRGVSFAAAEGGQSREGDLEDPSLVLPGAANLSPEQTEKIQRAQKLTRELDLQYGTGSDDFFNEKADSLRDCFCRIVIRNMTSEGSDMPDLIDMFCKGRYLSDASSENLRIPVPSLNGMPDNANFKALASYILVEELNKAALALDPRGPVKEAAHHRRLLREKESKRARELGLEGQEPIFPCWTVIEKLIQSKRGVTKPLSSHMQKLEEKQKQAEAEAMKKLHEMEEKKARQKAEREEELRKALSQPQSVE
ncbi:unnamed protein product [Amoebophrya sp. A25]|nr:unnamed protein product [Amoebophrya sp. A25]|eukprot:GSA25T00004003001.1